MRTEMNNLHECVLSAMARLSTKRPIFESKLDLRNSLAEELRHQDSSMNVSTELYINGVRSDIVLEKVDRTHLVQIKYPTQKLDYIDNNDTTYCLKFAANDLYRFQVLKEIVRVDDGVIKTGASGTVLVLSNVKALCEQPKPNNLDADFDISDGAVITGGVDWAPHVSPKFHAMHGPVEPLSGSYVAHWQPYSDLGVKNGTFQMMALLLEPS